MIKLTKGEEVLLTIRKHWFILAGETIFLLFLLCLPFLTLLVFKFLDTDHIIKISGSMTALFIFASSVFLLFVWISFFIIWTDYYLDILIVTNKHIIDVEQKGLFSRELSTFRLDKIQDVTAETNGIIQTFLSFGTICIQTAGEDQDFVVYGMPKPFEIKHMISRQQNVVMEKLRTVNISPESLKQLQDK